jgi:hypothetical protein
VACRLDDVWRKNLTATWGSQGAEHYGHAQEMVRALAEAGGVVLAGTDAAHPGAPGWPTAPACTVS